MMTWVRPCTTGLLATFLSLLVLSLTLSHPTTRHHVLGHPAVQPLLRRLGYDPYPFLEGPAVVFQDTAPHRNASSPAVSHRPPSKPRPHPSKPAIVCPDPFAAPLAPSPPPRLDRKVCQEVKTRAKDLKLRLCPLAAVEGAPSCNSFAVVVARRDSKHCAALDSATPGLNISSVPGEGDWVKATLGPDAFEVRSCLQLSRDGL